MFTLDFTDNAQNVLQVRAEERFGVCMQAIQTASAPAPFSAWDSVIELIKALRSIAGEENKPLYKLRPGGGVIKLSNDARQQLINFIKNGQWIPMHLEEVKSVLLWIQSAQESEETPDKLRLEA